MILENFYYQLFVVACLGLMLGSFYNVVIYRLSKNQSIISPASYCPNCGKELLWWHNIPVFSYIYLKGKCHYCDSKIDIQYPVIELITMCLFVACFLKFGLTLFFLKHIFALSCLLILSVFDIKEQEIPKALVYILAGILVLGFDVLGLLLALLIIGGSKYLSDNFFQKETIGFGDVIVLTILGGSVGLEKVLPLIILSVFGQFIICLPYWIRKIFSEKQYDVIKFGAWFLLSYFVLLGNKMYVLTYNNILILLLYLSLFTSLYFLCRVLFASVKSETFLTLPMLPAIFIGYLLVSF